MLHIIFLLLLALFNTTTLSTPIMCHPLSISICHRILLRDMQLFHHFVLYVVVVVVVVTFQFP